MPLDVLSNVIADLNANPELREIFGDPVCAGIVIVAEKDENGEIDLRLEDSGVSELSEEQSERFLDILNDVIKANSV